MLVLAVPSACVRSTARQHGSGLVADGQLIVCVAKGIEEEYPDDHDGHYRAGDSELPDAAVLSGPSHAEEVRQGHSHHLCGRGT